MPRTIASNFAVTAGVGAVRVRFVSAVSALSSAWSSIAAPVVVAGVVGLGGVIASSAHAQSDFHIQIPVLSDLAATAPSNFLGQVKNFVRVDGTRDVATMTKQAAHLALSIEEVQINFLMTFCKSAAIPARYQREVQLGCELLQAKAQLNGLRQKAVAVAANTVP